MNKSDIAVGAWVLTELAEGMKRRRSMPVDGWEIVLAKRLNCRSELVRAIKSNSWFPDVLKGATAAVGGDAILSRADINWEDKKGTSVLRLTGSGLCCFSRRFCQFPSSPPIRSNS